MFATLVLHKIGYPSTVMFMAGGRTGQFFTELVEKEDIETLVVPVEGSIRQNLIVHDGSNYLQYRFGMPGPDIAEREWRNYLCVRPYKQVNEYQGGSICFKFS